ncbi:MAG: hypothetical protein WBN40_04165 [Pseudomonadales bacterium]
MSHWLLFVLLAAGCAGLFYTGWRLAALGDWLVGWLHGCAIMLSFVIAILLLALAYAMTRLESIDGAQNLATISVSAVDDTSFFLEIADSSGESWYTSLSGDAWQLHARGVRFDGLLGAMLQQPAARLHSVSNRYYDFTRRAEARNVSIAPSHIEAFLNASGIDIWRLVSGIFYALEPLGFVNQTLQSDVLPMVDDALYSVHWHRTHLEVKPANEVARLSLLVPGSINNANAAALQENFSLETQ